MVLLSQTSIYIEVNNTRATMLTHRFYLYWALVINMGEEGLEPSRGITPIDPKSILSTKFQHPPLSYTQSKVRLYREFVLCASVRYIDLMRREGIEPSTL